jgi:hypothetical protein
MRRPWETDEEYEKNKNIKARPPPEDWEARRQAMRAGTPVPPPIPEHLLRMTPDERAHCMENGQQDNLAERSAACLIAKNGFMAHIDAFKKAGYLTADDLAAADFT